MSERIIKTGLSKKYEDMLNAVIGQMSDGYWENTPMMRGYWKFCDIGTAGDEVTIEVDETSGALDGDRRIVNRFYGMSDDAVKKFFADKIKFLIKEEGLGKWDRGNESETDFLSYGKPRYRVKDCYYAYETLKGRDARRHPEYGDVAEAKGRSPKRERGGTDDDSIESRLVYVGRLTGEYSDGLAWDLASITRQSRRIRLRVIELLDKFDEAIDAGDDDALVEIADDLKAFAGDESRTAEGVRANELAASATPAGESRTNEKRVMDTSEPYEISQIKEYMAKKGWTWNFNDKNSHFWFTKDGRPRIEGDLVPWSAYVLTNGNDIYFGRSLRNWKADMKAIGHNEANSNEAFEGWDDWEEIEGLEDALDGIENLTYELRHCVRGAKTHCKGWKALALYIKGLASNLDDAAELMAYKHDDEDESKKKNPSKDFSATVEEDEDGKKKSH